MGDTTLGHKGQGSVSQPPFCFACGMRTDVFVSPGVYPFPLCRLCDRMPRGQVLMAAQLFEIKLMLGSFLENLKQQTTQK